MNNLLEKNLQFLGIFELSEIFSKLEILKHERTPPPVSVGNIQFNTLAKVTGNKKALIFMPGMILRDFEGGDGYHSFFVFTNNLQELKGYLSAIDLTRFASLMESFICCTDYSENNEYLQFQVDYIQKAFKPVIEEIVSADVIYPSSLPQAELFSRINRLILNIRIEKLPTLELVAKGETLKDESESISVKESLKKSVILFPSTRWLSSGQFYSALTSLEEFKVIHIPLRQNGDKLFNESEIVQAIEINKPQAIFMTNLNALYAKGILYNRLINVINDKSLKVINFAFDSMIGQAKILAKVLKPELLYLFDIRKADIRKFSSIGFNAFPAFYSFNPVVLKIPWAIEESPEDFISFIGNIDIRKNSIQQIHKALAAFDESWRDCALKLGEFAFSHDYSKPVLDYLDSFLPVEDEFTSFSTPLSELQRGDFLNHLLYCGLPLKIFGLKENWDSYGIPEDHYGGFLKIFEDFVPVYRKAIFSIDHIRISNYHSFNDRVLPILMSGGLVALQEVAKAWEVFTEEEVDYYTSLKDIIELYNFYSRSQNGKRIRADKIEKAYNKAKIHTPERNLRFMFSKAGFKTKPE